MDQHQQTPKEQLDILLISNEMPEHWDILVQALEIKAWENIDLLLLKDEPSELPKQMLCAIFLVPIESIDPQLLQQINHCALFSINYYQVQQSNRMLVDEMEMIEFANFIDRQLSGYLDFFPAIDPRHVYFFEQLDCGLSDLIQMVVYQNIKEEHPYHSLEKFCNLLAYIQEYINDFYGLKYFNIAGFLYRQSIEKINSYFSDAFWKHIHLDYWQYMRITLQQLNQLDQNQQKDKLAKKYHQEIHDVLLSRHIARAQIMIDHHLDQIKVARQQDQSLLVGEVFALVLSHTQPIEELKEYQQANQLYLHTLAEILPLFLLNHLDHAKIDQYLSQYHQNEDLKKSKYEQLRNLELNHLFEEMRNHYYRKVLAN